MPLLLSACCRPHVHTYPCFNIYICMSVRRLAMSMPVLFVASIFHYFLNFFIFFLLSFILFSCILSYTYLMPSHFLPYICKSLTLLSYCFVFDSPLFDILHAKSKPFSNVATFNTICLTYYDLSYRSK